MLPSTIRALRAIRTALREGEFRGTCNYELANILSALRGPDYEDPSAVHKLSTTSLIRFVAIGGLFPGIVEHEDTAQSALVRSGSWLDPEGMCRKSPHFTSHARLAFQALGLSWDTSNGSLMGKPWWMQELAAAGKKTSKKAKKPSPGTAFRKGRRSGTRSKRAVRR